MLELLKKVLKPVAPSGLEEPVAAVIREEVAPYDLREERHGGESGENHAVRTHGSYRLHRHGH